MLEENKFARLKTTIERRIFPTGTDAKGDRARNPATRSVTTERSRERAQKVRIRGGRLQCSGLELPGDCSAHVRAGRNSVSTDRIAVKETPK
jgi:hypothetical protein